MTKVQSLTFNLEDGVDVQRHRTHRSIKGRNQMNKDHSPRYLKYKKKKWELKQEKVDENLRNFI